MAAPLLAELESLATTMRRRGWIARAAVVNEQTGVVSLCASTSATESRSAASNDAGDEPQETVAHLAVVDVDGAQWLYVDLGALRWMARVEPKQDTGRPVTWLTLELQKLGVTVERDATAQE
ncbi:MAG: hypothetical protein WCJ30_07285 [Deltaproteobacteria bacterium]